MSTESEYLRESIEPKSDQLNADDLLTGPITVTVTGVRRGDKEQPVIVDIEGHAERPFKPGKSMRRVLIAAYGDDPAKWIGKRMTLYCDPEVKFGGVKVGGIRISHLSEIPNDRTFMLTVTRGKKSEFIVKRLNDKPATNPEPPASEVDADRITAVKELWKAMRKRAGDPASAELWKAFVFATTGRPFDPLKSGEWTEDDYEKVHEAIDQQTLPTTGSEA